MRRPVGSTLYAAWRDTRGFLRHLNRTARRFMKLAQVHEITFSLRSALGCIPSLPATREELVALAATAPDKADEVHVLAELPAIDGGPAIEVDRVELARCAGGWCLQYVPYAVRMERFARVNPRRLDIDGYLFRLESDPTAKPARTHSCEAMASDGHGDPLARLDTRLTTVFPVFPTDADCDYVDAFLGIAPPAVTPEIDGRACPV